MNLISHNHNYKIITWAVLGGTVVALSAEIVLNFLGIGMGLSSFRVKPDTLTKISTCSIIWLTISGCTSMLLGGWVAGKISCCFQYKNRIMHGLLAWGLATLITVFVTATAAGTIVGGFTNVVSGSVNNITLSADNATGNVEINSNQDAEDFSELSMAMSIAFLLSAIASMGGAAFARPEGTTEGFSDENPHL
ncbi:MAG: hypothetical protein PHC75_03225 [Burkholderiales bacterium]|nr:hypothetical protein [Burkholderiales bacterium]